MTSRNKKKGEEMEGKKTRRNREERTGDGKKRDQEERQNSPGGKKEWKQRK